MTIDDLTLCRFAASAYDDHRAPAGAILLREFDRWGTTAMVWRLWEAEELVVSYRGTDSLLDGLMDVRYAKRDFPDGPGRVHRGFYDARQMVWGALAEFLERFNMPVAFVGHSLGGALAILSAASFAGSRAVTWGAPRVGNAAFAMPLSGKVTRYENRGDVVTEIPFERYNPGQVVWAWLHGRAPTGYAKECVPIILDGKGHAIAGYLAAMERHLSQE